MTDSNANRATLWRSVSRFGLLGVVSLVLNLGITIGLHELAGAPEELSFAVALVTVFFVNFLVCRFFVFDASSGDPRRQFVGFLLSSLAFRGAEYATFLVVHTWLGAPYVATILGILGASTVLKFAFYRRMVFRPASGGAAAVPPGVPSSLEPWHLAILTGVIALVFCNTLHNAMHLDDIYRIEQNTELERVRPILRHFTDPNTSAALPTLVQFRPMLPLSLSFNHAASDAVGLDRLVGLHLGNIALHGAVCCLFYLFVVQLVSLAAGRDPTNRDRHLAFGAALLLAVHPVSGVPVNYLCARDLLMMMAFLLGALLVYLRMRRSGDSVTGWIIVLGLFTGSMLSKQNSVMAPVLIVLIEGLIVRRRAVDMLWRPLVFATVPAAYFAWTIFYLEFSDLDMLEPEEGSAGTYALTMAKVHVFYYLRNVVWPFAMRPRPFIEPAAGLADPAVLAGGAFIAATFVAAFWWRRRAPVASFCILAYWLLFAPTSSIRPFRSPATDYRQYPSLAFLSLLVVLGLALIPHRRLRAGAMAALVGLAASATFFHTNGVWRTEESLWEQAIRYPATSLSHMNYGRSVQRRDPALGEQHYRIALEQSPNHVYANINLGMLLVGQGRTAEGLAHARHAVAAAPDWAIAHYWLGEALRLAGDVAGAQVASARAADIDHRNVLYQYQAAYDLQRAGKVIDSIPYLQRITRVNPDYRDAAFLEGYAFQTTGDWKNAERRYRRFLDRHEEHAQARFNLAHGLMESGEYDEAIEQFLEVLHREPERKATHYWLAQCYAAVGDERAAQRHKALYGG